MADLDKAIAAAREALRAADNAIQYSDTPVLVAAAVDALHNILAALDVQPKAGEVWQYRASSTSYGKTWVDCRDKQIALGMEANGFEIRCLYAAPPAALASISALEVFRIAGGDTECCPDPTADEALECLRDLRQCYDEALRAQQPAAAVPEGYALVPVEPTTAMKCRAVEAWEGPAVYKSMFARGLADLEDKAAECWAAMLAAAERKGE